MSVNIKVEGIEVRAGEKETITQSLLGLQL
jgi:hypothetical protein